MFDRRLKKDPQFPPRYRLNSEASQPWELRTGLSFPRPRLTFAHRARCWEVPFFLTGLEDVCVSRPSSFLLETPLYIMHEVILGKYYPGNIFNLLPRRLPARGSCRMQIVRETLMSFECWVGKGLFLNFGSSEGKNMWLGKCHDGQRGILLMTQARLGHPSPFITEIQHILLIRSLAWLIE